MTEDPDVIVQTALQLLPIPPHGDGFWARFEQALDAETAPDPAEPVRRVIVAATEEPDLAPVVELDPSLALVPPALRRPSNAVLLAVAAVAVVVVGLAASTLIEQREGDDAVSSGPPQALTNIDQTLNEARAGGAAAAPLELTTAESDASSQAVMSWVKDLGTGEGEQAWTAMGEASQGHFASQAEFEGLMTDLAEGFGAWSAAEPDEVLVTPVAAADEGTIAVVTLIGSVEQEGTMQDRADAFPVRLVDGEAVVEPFASAGDLEVVLPEPGAEDGELAPMPADGELVFVVPSTSEAPVLRIDGGEPVICGAAEGTELHDLEDTPGQRCEYSPEGGLAVGEHTVTVAFVGQDSDSITAESLLFDAA